MIGDREIDPVDRRQLDDRMSQDVMHDKADAALAMFSCVLGGLLHSLAVLGSVFNYLCDHDSRKICLLVQY